VAGRGQGRDEGVVGRVAIEPQVDEEPIRAVGLDRGRRLADNRQDTLALLAGAFGNELLDPIAEAGQRGRGDKGHFVAPGLSQAAESGPQHGGVVVGDGVAVAQRRIRCGHGGPLQQLGHIYADQRRTRPKYDRAE